MALRGPRGVDGRVKFNETASKAPDVFAAKGCLDLLKCTQLLFGLALSSFPP